jgi:hypothetical protein
MESRHGLSCGPAHFTRENIDFGGIFDYRRGTGWEPVTRGGMESDSVYFAGRAQQEREAAMRATHEAARRAHTMMAARYAELASAIERHQDLLAIGETNDPIAQMFFRGG